MKTLFWKSVLFLFFIEIMQAILQRVFSDEMPLPSPKEQVKLCISRCFIKTQTVYIQFKIMNEIYIILYTNIIIITTLIYWFNIKLFKNTVIDQYTLLKGFFMLYFYSLIITSTSGPAGAWTHDFRNPLS